MMSWGRFELSPIGPFGKVIKYFRLLFEIINTEDLFRILKIIFTLQSMEESNFR